jgi:hypothetical protein
MCTNSFECKDHLSCSKMEICECKKGYYWFDGACHLQNGYNKHCMKSEWCKQNTVCDMNTKLCSCLTGKLFDMNSRRCGK